MEIWKDIEGYEGLYQISSYGRIKSLRDHHGNYREKILKQGTRKDGYKNTALSKDGKLKTYSVHRLVAAAFLDNPNNYPCVNHKDEQKYNNYVENLEWCTSKYNCNYGTKSERQSKAITGENNPMYGKHHTEETKKKIRESKIGKHHTEETKRKIRESRIGENNPRSRKVQCINTGEIFNTVKEATEWCNLKGKCIIHQIKGKQKTAGKHPVTKEPLQWKYID